MIYAILAVLFVVSFVVALACCIVAGRCSEAERRRGLWRE